MPPTAPGRAGTPLAVLVDIDGNVAGRWTPRPALRTGSGVPLTPPLTPMVVRLAHEAVRLPR